MRKPFFWLALLAFGGLLGAAATVCVQSGLESQRAAERQALFAQRGGDVSPKWMAVRSTTEMCRPATARERARDQAFLAILTRGDLAPVQFAQTLHYFSGGYREGRLDRCAPSADTFRTVGEMIRSSQLKSGCTPEMIGPVNLMPPSEWMAERLAKCALESSPIRMSGADLDVRILWMNALATQEHFAQPWYNQLSTRMSLPTAYGRSAAGAAMAANLEQALPKVEKLFKRAIGISRSRQILAHSDSGEVEAISPGDGQILMQFAYSLSVAGPKADDFAAPLMEVMELKFALPAPPFGLLASHMTQLCPIAEHIGGRTATYARTKRFCEELKT